MAYVTTDELAIEAGGSVRFLALTDWNSDGVSDDDVVAQAIDYVSAWAEGFLSDRFDTTQLRANPPTTVKQLIASEVIYWLRCRREPEAMVDHKLHDERLKELKDLATGQRRPSEPLPVKSTSVAAAFVENDHAVSRRGMRGTW